MKPVRAHSKPILTFNGIDQFLQSAIPIDIEYNDAFTIEFWIKYNTFGTGDFIMSSEEASTAKGLRLEATNGFLSFLMIRDLATARVQVTSDVALTLGDWQHFKIISIGAGNAAGISFEIDSASVAKTPNVDQDISAGIVSTENLHICTRPGQDSGFVDCEIADFKMTKNGSPYIHTEIYEGMGTLLLDSQKNINFQIEGAVWALGQSGCNDTLATNPTETGVNQLIDKELNYYPLFDRVVAGQIDLNSSIQFPGTQFTVSFNVLTPLNIISDQRIIQFHTGNQIFYKGNALQFWLNDLSVGDAINAPVEPYTIYEFICTAKIELGNVIMSIYKDGIEVASRTDSFAQSNFSYMDGIRNFSDSPSMGGLLWNINIYDEYTSDGNLAGLNKIHSYLGVNDNWEDNTGTNDGTSTVAEIINIIENGNNIGYDLLSSVIEKSIKIGGIQKKWNIYSGTWFETQDTLSSSEFAAMIVIDGLALSTLTEAILIDARDANDNGLLMWLNASGYPEIQYNTQDVAGVSTLANALQLLTFYVTDTDIKIRIDGVEVATATKTEGAISTTALMTLFAESFGTRTNFFEGQCAEPFIIKGNVSLSTLETQENNLMTKYGI